MCSSDLAHRILSLSVLRGVLSIGSSETVTFVNAPQLAEKHGLTVTDSKSAHSPDYRNMITVRTSCGHSIAGTLAGLRMEPRIVMVDEHTVEVPPSKHLLVVRNDDRPGMIGVLGTTLAKHGVNISTMALGRARTGGTSLMMVATDQAVPGTAIEELRATSGIHGVDSIDDA